MIQLKSIHHIAIICTDYAVSKAFYTQVLGLTLLQEIYRAERDSYKADLALNGQYVVELFSFPQVPARLSFPEAAGLRHLAFAVEDVAAARQELMNAGVTVQEIRVDEHTGQRFCFFSDPDGLPLELYEG
ncbi:VOC family protein [Rufibacter glacialis]|uniref:VOC family protein n=1 Tax=Rufibacter glacialis TaxID=1259555 RepID=A0A5M8QE35_9BACT|nr:VOC family protein [Rufibacter glacialis]KAA6433351.1 VOC family protein [Rufibacter glacialis]GGK75086.1 VOC family protein [Rufibacter glacialis]